MTDLAFLEALDDLPGPGRPERVELGFRHWSERVSRLEDPALAEFARWLPRDPRGRRMLEAVFGNSPFLTHCVLSDIAFLARLLSRDAGAVLGEVLDELKRDLADTTDSSRAMAELRSARRRVALLTGLADFGGAWALERTLTALSDFADTALCAGLNFLLRRAAERNELDLADPADPTAGCGYVVLGMGKLGARELNYSSDIDLIVLYEPERARYRHARGPQEGFVRLTRDLVRLLEERTAEGYVFRTDLRLRPDPGAMPVALSVNAALTYYESMGQNWERAAMIKARPCAGDLPLGQSFLEEIRPFVWRKSLDFAAIQDIHSIKRQIHAHKGGAAIAVLGHNIKLGRGGIREIELFAQTQQLIWGGREPQLRSPQTLAAITALAEAGHVAPAAAADLHEAYVFLRRLEHRLQMVDDQQTQRLPDDEAGLSRIATFLGYVSAASFRAALLATLRRVEDHYAELFEEAPVLSPTGNLVFTGGEPEPGTLATLQDLGFADGAKVFNLVRAWHHGRHRATRSTRARELLTELMPTLLGALGKTTQPDLALTKFDEFLSRLPAGVQLFSMLYANPKLLDLLAEIMGGAPALAERLSHNPALLDAVLSGGFFDALPNAATLDREFASVLTQARDFQDVLDLSRRWANDRRFQVGVHILQHISDVDESGRALSDIAEAVVKGLMGPVLEDFAKSHGRVAGAGLAVVAMGKLGGGEMTVSSDLDLTFIYETEPEAAESDGAKPLAPSHYFARLAQRFINALTAMTPEGRLYEIDMRLRPSGNAGPIATSLSGWRQYYERDSWTWEHMALTRARAVAGDPGLQDRIGSAIRDTLCAPRDPDALLIDVLEMRERIERERPAKTIWSVKFLRGGLTDLEFLAQYLLLRHAAEHPEIIDGATQRVFANLAEAGLLDRERAKLLIGATRLIRQIQGMLRLTAAPAFDADQASESLKSALARAAGLDDFATLRHRLIETAQAVHEIFIETIEAPAREALAQRGGRETEKPAR